MDAQAEWAAQLLEAQVAEQLAERHELLQAHAALAAQASYQQDAIGLLNMSALADSLEGEAAAIAAAACGGAAASVGLLPCGVELRSLDGDEGDNPHATSGEGEQAVAAAQEQASVGQQSVPAAAAPTASTAAAPSRNRSTAASGAAQPAASSAHTDGAQSAASCLPPSSLPGSRSSMPSQQPLVDSNATSGQSQGLVKRLLNELFIQNEVFIQR